MHVRFLGTGTSLGVPVIGCDCKVCHSSDPRDMRLRSSLFVSWKGIRMVIDTGPDFRQQMLSSGIRDISAIFITHAHKDHTAGLDDIRAFNYMQRRSMDIYAYPEVLEALRMEFSYAFNPDPYPGVPEMLLHEINDDAFNLGPVSVQPIKVMHGKMPVAGFRIGDLTYITDCSEIPPSSMEQIRGTRVFIINALRHKPHHSHFTLEQALDVARDIGAERTYLTHISHYLGSYEELNSKLPDGIFLAYDGLEI